MGLTTIQVLAARTRPRSLVTNELIESELQRHRVRTSGRRADLGPFHVETTHLTELAELYCFEGFPKARNTTSLSKAQLVVGLPMRFAPSSRQTIRPGHELGPQQASVDPVLAITNAIERIG